MIEVLGMTGCVPCKETKKLLGETDLDFAYYNVKTRGNKRTQELKRAFFEAGVDNTVMPAIFVDGVYHGSGVESAKELV